MKRFRKQIPAISPEKEHEKYAKNDSFQKLESSWSPFYEDSNNGYKSIDYCFDVYLKNIEKEKDDSVIRPNAFRS